MIVERRGSGLAWAVFFPDECGRCEAVDACLAGKHKVHKEQWLSQFLDAPLEPVIHSHLQ